MKQTKLIMGMPITIEIIDTVPALRIKEIFDYFRAVDARFSTYKPASEISRINSGLPKNQWSREMKQILSLCQQTKLQTGGYFDISRNGRLDPSGLVKGWAIRNAADLLAQRGIQNFYIEAGGDIQVRGTNASGQPWAVGIRNPFNVKEIIKVVQLTTEGIATSGTYVRGEHIYNPLGTGRSGDFVKSLTVIGPNVYEADRFATAAFAMGEQGLGFIESMPGLEAYMVDSTSVATLTSGFAKYLPHA